MSFDDRKRGQEKKFELDQELEFKAQARRAKLVGLWAADKMKLTPEEADAYAKAVIRAEFEEAGDEDVVRKLVGDLIAAGIETDEAAMRAALDEKMVEARRALMGEA